MAHCADGGGGSSSRDGSLPVVGGFSDLHDLLVDDFRISGSFVGTLVALGGTGPEDSVRGGIDELFPGGTFTRLREPELEEAGDLVVGDVAKQLFDQRDLVQESLLPGLDDSLLHVLEDRLAVEIAVDVVEADNLGEIHDSAGEAVATLQVAHDVLEVQKFGGLQGSQAVRQKHLCLLPLVVCHVFLPLALCPRVAGLFWQVLSIRTLI